MEWKIGEIKQVNGDWYQCIRSNTRCTNCGFNSNKGCMADTYLRYICSSGPVIFQKLEKVGEPLIKALLLNPSQYLLVQKYRVEVTPTIMPNELHFNALDNTIEIEVKSPIKEDMEEKKTNFVEEIEALCKRYNMSDGVLADFISEMKEIIKDSDTKLNLKPFDLEAAKSGKPVCTRDGRKARIICFDRNDLYPIVALIECEDGKEIIGAYSKDGQTEIDEIKGTNLMMLPEKKGRWMNVYRNKKGEYWSEQVLFSTKKDAIDFVHDNAQYVTTVKVEWEE